MKWIVLLLSLITLQVNAQKKSVELFHIERNLNSNIVVYAANIDKNGYITTKEPMQAYWIMNAEDGQREDLNFMERKMAYGFKCKKTATVGVYKVILVADKKRNFHLKQSKAFKPQIHTLINGEMCHLTKMKIEADNGTFMPKVKYIDLEGINSKGVKITERYKPEK